MAIASPRSSALEMRTSWATGRGRGAPLRRAASGALLSLCLLPVAAAAQAADSSPAHPAGAYTSDMSLPSAEQRMREVAIKVAPGIYAFHAPLSDGPAPLANEMLVEQKDGLVLIDAGKTRGAGARIVALIRGISAKPVKAVIITHWHPDHVLGLGPIIEAWPHAAIIASVATRNHIRDDDSYRGVPRAPGLTATRDSSRAAVLRQYADQSGGSIRDPKLSDEEHRGWADVIGVLDLRIHDERGTYLVLPTVTFTDEYLLEDPVAPVEARFIGPAHTDGDVVAWAPRQRVVAAGDMVVAPIPFGGSHVLQWPATLRRLEALHPRVIVPGHGPIQPDARYVDRMIEGLNAIRREAERLAGGPPLSADDATAQAKLSATKRAFAGQDPWLAYWFDQYFAPNIAVAYDSLRANRPH